MQDCNKTNICPVCFKQFNSKAHLKQHLNKKYKCTKNTEPENTTTSSENNIITEDGNQFSSYTSLLNETKKKHADYVKTKKQNNILQKENKHLKMQIQNIFNIVNNSILFCNNNDKEFNDEMDDSNNSNNSTSNMGDTTISSLTNFTPPHPNDIMNCNSEYIAGAKYDNLDKITMVKLVKQKS